MLIGERQPSLNEIAQQQGLDAIGKGKGKGKGHGKCFNCGEPGHIARDCTEPKGGGKGDTADLFALQYKGKGKKGGRGFQGKCFNCGKIWHTAAECRAAKRKGKGGKAN